MLTPRYFFSGDFRQFYECFLSQPHEKRYFQKGDYVWKPGSPYGNLYYIVSGAAVHGAEHENGHRKIISFHGPGTVFPGYHQADYKIGLSLSMSALSELRAKGIISTSRGKIQVLEPAALAALCTWEVL